MTSYSGKKKVKTAIFVSGSGTNLKNLIKFSKKVNSPISINFVISNNLKSKGFLFAKKNKIRTVFYSFNNDKDYEILLSKLFNLNIKLICLAGFMKIIPKSFLKNFKGKILNIHPSLLPKYKGLNTHERALKNKEKFVGCTVHFVSNKLDSGKIIIQKKTRLSKKDTISTIKKRVLKLEHKIYPIAIKKILL